MVRVRVGIRVYVKPLCSAAKPQKPKSRENLGERFSKSHFLKDLIRLFDAPRKLSFLLRIEDSNDRNDRRATILMSWQRQSTAFLYNVTKQRRSKPLIK